MVFLKDFIGPFGEVSRYHFYPEVVSCLEVFLVLLVQFWRHCIIRPNGHDLSIGLHLLHEVLSDHMDLHVGAAALSALHFVNVTRQLIVIVKALQIHRMYLNPPLGGDLLILFHRGVVKALDKALLMETSPIDYVKEDLYGPFPAVPVSCLVFVLMNLFEWHLDFDGK